MKRLIYAIIFVIVALPSSGQMPPPQPGLVLWPPGVRMEQMFELRGDELEQTLSPYDMLSGVRSIRVIDYTMPGPPAPPDRILEFYASALREPAWHQFFQSSRAASELASVAYRGPQGFISVLARPRGATVTHIEGEIDLADIPTLEKVVREAVARRDQAPIEARNRVEAAVQLRQAGKNEEAAAELRAILTDYPNVHTAHFILAQILVERNRFDEAGQEFRCAIGIAPLDSICRAEYALFLQKRGDKTNARYELEQAATIDPWTAPLQLMLAHFLEDEGQLRGAEEHYRRAVQLVGNSPEMYMDLGRVLEKQGRKREAREVYRDALKLRSNFQPARDAIRRLEG